jgi:multidrug resistance efflux pump
MIVRCHVGSIARGINVQHTQGGPQGPANVNPIFIWVRLAQRTPMRIHIDHVPDGVTLAAGLTVTAEIEPQARPALDQPRAR